MKCLQIRVNVIGILLTVSSELCGIAWYYQLSVLRNPWSIRNRDEPTVNDFLEFRFIVDCGHNKLLNEWIFFVMRSIHCFRKSELRIGTDVLKPT